MTTLSRAFEDGVHDNNLIIKARKSCGLNLDKPCTYLEGTLLREAYDLGFRTSALLNELDSSVEDNELPTHAQQMDCGFMYDDWKRLFTSITKACKALTGNKK